MRDSKGENVEYWDRLSGKYDQFIDKRIRNYDEIVDRIAQDVEGSANILEMGAGTALIALKITSKFRHVDAVDISERMIDIARDKARKAGANNIDFHVCSCYELPFSDNDYDAVIISNTLHIMKHPEKALAEAGRLLKDNVKLIVPTFMHGETLTSSLISRIMTTLSGFTVYHRWKSDNFRIFLEENGFNILTFDVLSWWVIPMVYAMATPVKSKV